MKTDYYFRPVTVVAAYYDGSYYVRSFMYTVVSNDGWAIFPDGIRWVAFNFNNVKNKPLPEPKDVKKYTIDFNVPSNPQRIFGFYDLGIGKTRVYPSEVTSNRPTIGRIQPYDDSEQLIVVRPVVQEPQIDSNLCPIDGTGSWDFDHAFTHYKKEYNWDVGGRILRVIETDISKEDVPIGSHLRDIWQRLLGICIRGIPRRLNWDDHEGALFVSYETILSILAPEATDVRLGDPSLKAYIENPLGAAKTAMKEPEKPPEPGAPRQVEGGSVMELGVGRDTSMVTFLYGHFESRPSEREYKILVDGYPIPFKITSHDEDDGHGTDTWDFKASDGSTYQASKDVYYYKTVYSLECDFIYHGDSTFKKSLLRTIQVIPANIKVIHTDKFGQSKTLFDYKLNLLPGRCKALGTSVKKVKG